MDFSAGAFGGNDFLRSPSNASTREAAADALGALLTDAVHQLKPATLDELPEVFERRDFELLVERARRLDADAVNVEQVEHRRRRLRRQTLPRVERPALDQFDDLRADGLAHARNRLQAFDAFLTRNLLDRRRPRLDHLRGGAVRPQAELVLAADLQQQRQTLEPPRDLVVRHHSPGADELVLLRNHVL